jgi:hypothetical protein
MENTFRNNQQPTAPAHHFTPTPVSVISETIGRSYERPALKAPKFQDQLIDFTPVKHLANCLKQLQ